MDGGEPYSELLVCLSNEILHTGTGESIPYSLLAGLLVYFHESLTHLPGAEPLKQPFKHARCHSIGNLHAFGHVLTVLHIIIWLWSNPNTQSCCATWNKHCSQGRCRGLSYSSGNGTKGLAKLSWLQVFRGSLIITGCGIAELVLVGFKPCIEISFGQHFPGHGVGIDHITGNSTPRSNCCGLLHEIATCFLVNLSLAELALNHCLGEHDRWCIG